MISIENFEKKIIPLPVNVKKGNGIINLGNLSEPLFAFEAIGEGVLINSAKECIYNAFSEYMISPENAAGSYKLTIKTDCGDERFEGKGKKEGYLIDINKDCAEIIGFDDAGTFYGAVTFAQILFYENDNVFVPECKILDYPHFDKRGQFFECRYGSDFMTLDDWKKAIDYFAMQKINTLTVALYGCWVRQYDGVLQEYQYVPFKKYPDLKTPRSIKYYSAKQKKYIFKDNVLPVIYEEDYFGDMISYAKKKNITVIPFFNSLGHNTLIPRVVPEISPIDEEGNPTGVAFCTRNPKTYEVMFNIYDEIIERYLKPNGIDMFAVGLDEVAPVRGVDKNNLNTNKSPICQCEKCKGVDHMELMMEYVVNVVKYLKSRGMKRVYVDDDMFVMTNNLVNEKTIELLKKEDIYDVFGMDWWDYRASDRIYEGKKHSKSHLVKNNSLSKPTTGYYNWSAYSDATDNLVSMTKVAVEKEFEGLVAYSSYDLGYDYGFSLSAECAWNPNAVEMDKTYEKYCITAFPENLETVDVLKKAYPFWRSGCEKLNITMTYFDYYPYSYHMMNREYPQDYPAKGFKHIEEDEENCLNYAENCIKTMEEVYAHFDKIHTWRADFFKHSALTYKFLNDYFLSLYNCNKKYKEDGDIVFFKSEISRLISEAESLISLTEDVRIEANQYTFVRNISIMRQALRDLLEYIDNDLKSCDKPEIDVMNFGQYLGEISKFLR